MLVAFTYQGQKLSGKLKDINRNAFFLLKRYCRQCSVAGQLEYEVSYRLSGSKDIIMVFVPLADIEPLITVRRPIIETQGAVVQNKTVASQVVSSLAG